MDEEKTIIEELLSKGALEYAGVSDTGEILYNFTPMLKNVMPALYNEHLNHVNSELMNLWEKGFIEMNLFDDNPVVRLSPKAFSDDWKGLSKDEQWSLREIMRILKNKL